MHVRGILIPLLSCQLNGNSLDSNTFNKEMILVDCVFVLSKETSFVPSQMTLTADEVIFYKICATDDIETILDRFGRFNTISCTHFMEK